MGNLAKQVKLDLCAEIVTVIDKEAEWHTKNECPQGEQYKAGFLQGLKQVRDYLVPFVVHE